MCYPSRGPRAPPLLCLSAVDGGLGVGIDHNTALVACSIIAGNWWVDSWLGVKSNSDLDRDNSRDKQSQIWRFPHDNLLDIRDQTCRITGYYEGGEVAQLIPASHVGWFESNETNKYCRLPSRSTHRQPPQHAASPP
ncbi:hypothetical protein VTK73DRAFT_983 [Phialemonium thermophilum]|uniref:HNH nuclease domain-containing protein n=1 Tax=Phialemonium thermophilum TaxID=223376 RepID=A0ABR3XBV4_9PEZI